MDFASAISNFSQGDPEIVSDETGRAHSNGAEGGKNNGRLAGSHMMDTNAGKSSIAQYFCTSAVASDSDGSE